MKRSRVRWDATEGSSGGVESTAREAVSDMEKYDYNVEDVDQGTVTLAVDLARAFQKSAVESRTGVDHARRLPAANSLGALWVRSASAKGALWRMRSGPAADCDSYPSRLEWLVLL